MKLAAIYNVFDSEEILQKSINSIKNNVDYIIIVLQKISNFGIKHNIDIEEYIHSLNGIDNIHIYTPNLSLPSYKNEFNKRIIGCKKSLENNCTHFLHLDCDEIYDNEQFKNAKKYIEDNDIDSSACEIIDYYKYENLQVISENSYVPFIHKLEKNKTNFGVNLNYPVIVDSTRKTNPINNFKLFSKNEIYMHHFSWIRDNIKIKLLNSTARNSYINFIDLIEEEFNNFNLNDKLVKLETGLLVPYSLAKKINFPFKEVKTKII